LGLDFTDFDGVTRRIEELALQQWDGEHIVTEQFFYDTKTVWAVVS
jgi:hypothetical protein